MEAAVVLLPVESCGQLSDLYAHTHQVMGTKDFKTAFQKAAFHLLPDFFHSNMKRTVKHHQQCTVQWIIL